ncbi:GNAT family N-acetyltransferase [Pseudochrobactrum sp. MP213Fo]|uniref:GNAT family N-acetyltransferase n=1 Tax=Pseudochrobactrum sp. MP213Fo TaxID=3022250 RepID=UPI003B9EDA0B
MQDLSLWTARNLPERKVLEGRTVRLEPLDAARHAQGLFEASSVDDAGQRFTWLFEYAPETPEQMRPWLEKSAVSVDPLFFAVVDKVSGKAAGRQALMRIDAVNGSAEIGHIYWGPLIARKVAATEAQYLFMRYIFDELGYRRYEWKCNNDNLPSKRAAERFGFQFEGVFRQHLVAKGKNRDTAWFSIIDSEWPALKLAYEAWLAPENFDASGQQLKRLEEFRA